MKRLSGVLLWAFQLDRLNKLSGWMSLTSWFSFSITADDTWQELIQSCTSFSLPMKVDESSVPRYMELYIWGAAIGWHWPQVTWRFAIM